ncbi:regulator of RNase E activity RraA [Bradyrhizobium sp. i1.4.4]
MTITIAANSVPRPPAEIIEGFRGAPTSVISDNLARLPGAVGLKPYHRGGKLVGTAFTVRTRPGDNLAIHRALELVGPGDVIVVDGGGDETRALVGEIMKNIAQWRKAEGYVIDGAIRDVAAFAADDFPCYAPRGDPSRPLQERPRRDQRACYDRRQRHLARRHRRRR